MPTDSGKKVIILYILQILQKYTDEEHTMTQQQIMEKLRDDYGLEVNRSTVRRNLSDLIDAGYGIQYSEIVRTRVDRATRETEENVIYTDLYYEHDFTGPELHMLIDGLLFSRSVPYRQRRELIDKLGKLSGVHFNRRMNHVHCMAPNAPQNPELFHTIDMLDEAITAGKQVRITYNQYGTDMKLHPTLTADGQPRRQVLNPYQLVASDGRYYLICNNDRHDSVSNYRVDRITDIELLETPVKPKNQVAGLEDGLNLQAYMVQNPNMFSGPAERAVFRIPRRAVSLVIDYFGSSVSFFDDGGETIRCSMLVSREAISRWAVQFANTVVAEEPPELVEEIRAEVKKAAEAYGLG